jgi:hypothetical protein
MVHCAQEVNHLAAVLPDIYQAFGTGELAQGGKQ